MTRSRGTKFKSKLSLKLETEVSQVTYMHTNIYTYMHRDILRIYSQTTYFRDKHATRLYRILKFLESVTH